LWQYDVTRVQFCKAHTKCLNSITAITLRSFSFLGKWR